MNGSAPRLMPLLARDEVILLDGGLATELERRGADLRDPLWSARLLLDQPDLIRQVHLDYFRAGAAVATSASYQASLPGLQQRGLDAAQARDVLLLSVRLAQAARADYAQESSRPTFVAASLGCYGAALHDGSEYRGDYNLSVSALRDWHRPRFEILAESDADLLAFETIPCLAEAEAIVRLLAERPAARAWVCFSCRDDVHLCHGEPMREAAALLDACPSVLALGVNCTAPRHVAGLLAVARTVTTKPLVAYPNSGEAWDNATWRWIASDETTSWGTAATTWRDLGARLIGGCCRTTPATIRAMSPALGSAEP
jgi:homocysteine S-methyltransferase